MARAHRCSSESEMRVVLFSCCFLLLLKSATTLMFDLPPSKVKCFSEDVPDSTLVMGKYSVTYLGQAENETGEFQPTINVQV